LEPDEIRLIWNLPKGQYRDILRLLLLTACRAKEIAALQWGEVHDDMIVLPPERRKTRKISKKKPTAHIVPLSEPARAILAAQPRSADGFVFGRVNGRPFSGWGASKIHADDVIEKAAGKPLKHWTPHDLRRTAATRMADPLGIAPYVIESCLGHVGHKAGIGGTYILSNYERDKRRALDQWGEHVMAIIEGRESNVVTLRA
jgi:integrase